MDVVLKVSSENLEHFSSATSFSSLLGFAFRFKTLPERFLINYRLLMQELKSNGGYVQWIQSINIAKAVALLNEPLDLERHEDYIVPVIRKDPALFHAPLHGDARKVLLDLMDPEAKSMANAIFERSFLLGEGFQYSTIDTDLGPSIKGKNDSQFPSLVGISHELGHCMIEEEFRANTLQNKIVGEIFAQLFEQFIITAFLKKEAPSLVDAWEAYQIQIDALNLHLFLAEIGAIGLDREGQFEPCFFPMHSLVLRESFFTMPGFQIVYLLASIHRKILRASNPFDTIDYLKRAKDLNFEF